MSAIVIDTQLDSTGFENGYKRITQATKTFVSNTIGSLSSLKQAFSSTANVRVAPADLAKMQADLLKAQNNVAGLTNKMKELQAQKDKINSGVAARGIVSPEDTARLENIRLKMATLEAQKTKIASKGVMTLGDAEKVSAIEVKLAQLLATKSKIESKKLITADEQSKLNAIDASISNISHEWQTAQTAVAGYQARLDAAQAQSQEQVSSGGGGMGGSIGSSMSTGVAAGIASLIALGYAANATSDKIINVFKKVTTSIIGFFADMASPIIETIKQVEGALASAFNIQNIIAFGKESLNAASALQSAYTGLQSIVDGQGRNFAQAKAFIQDYVKDGLIPATDAITAYKNLAARGYSDSQIVDTMNRLKDASAFGRQASLSMGEAVKTATEGLKNENSILVDNSGVTKNVAQMWKEYALSIGTTADKLTKQQKIQAEVSGIMEETKFQMGDAQKVAGSYQGSVTNLGFAFNALKVAVGNAIMPLASLVIPVISQIIGVLTQLFSVVGQVMTVLFGVKATMSDNASATQKASNATGNATKSTTDLGKAAKKTNKEINASTSSLDELSKFSQSAADATADAADSIDGANLGGNVAFDNVEMPEPEVPWIKDLAKKLMSLNVDYGYFFDMGRKIGEYLTSGLKSIPWDTIQAWAKSTMDKIVAFLNGAVVGIDWAAVGNTIAQGLNTILIVADSFLSGFDFMKFGNSIATGFNAFIDGFNWELLGKTLGDKLMAVVDFAAGFVFQFDFSKFGKRLSDTVNSFFATVNWSEVGLTVGTAIIGIFNSISSFLAGVDWKKIGQSIMDFIAAIDWAGIRDAIVQALDNLKAGEFDLFSQIFGEDKAAVIMSFIDAIVTGIAVIKSAMVGIGAIMVGIVALIGYFAIGLTAIVDWIGGAGAAIGDFFNKVSEVFTWLFEKVIQFQFFIPTVIAAIGVAIGEGLAWFISNLGTIITNAVTIIQTAFNAVVTWFSTSVITPIVNFFIGLGVSISTAFSNAVLTIQTAFGMVASWFSTTVITPIATFFSNLGTNIGTAFTNAITTVKNIWGGISSWFTTTVIDPIRNGFSGIATGIEGVFAGMVNIVVRAVNSIISGLNSISVDVPDWVPNFGGQKFGFNIAPLGEVKVPRLATGAVIPPNKEFLATLGDQTSGTNIETPEKLLRDIYREENSPQITLLQRIAEAIEKGQVIMVDNEVMGKSVTNSQINRDRQIGRTLQPR